MHAEYLMRIDSLCIIPFSIFALQITLLQTYWVLGYEGREHKNETLYCAFDK
jgi:hypothetical protein